MSNRVLVVGCGSIGERHLRCFLKINRTEVIACETNPTVLDSIREKYKVRGFADLKQALASQDFNGVLICTPAHTHIPLALDAVRVGAGVLVEKPLSTNLEKIEELREAAGEAGCLVALAYIYHSSPAVIAIREVIRSGSLGKPLHMNVVSGQHFPTFRPAYREVYYTRHETGGGAIQDALTHFANLVEWLAGPTTEIWCQARHQSLEGVEVEDTVTATARNGDVLVSYTLNQFQAPNESTVQIHCENGSLKFELHEQRWGVFRRGTNTWEYHSTPVKDRDDWFVAQANAFLDALEGKPNLLCTLDEGIQTLRFNLAALQSARTGQPVTIA